MRRRLPASSEDVDRFCLELRGNLLAALPAGERFAVELLLREALMNAIVHGARESKPEIHCEVKLVKGGVELSVSDNGNGFDWRARTAVEPPLSQENGRGLLLLNHYASRVQFSKTGNRIQITRKFRKGDADEFSDAS